MLGEWLEQRLSDARVTTSSYTQLLARSDLTETEVQRFLEANPWLLGLEYVKIRPRRLVPRGALDFILERYDGLHDVLELKTPQDPIVVAPDAVEDVPPTASQFSLSAALAQALAQVHVYGEVLSEDGAALETRYGLSGTRHPRLFILIGQAKTLPSHRRRVLRNLNLSLHRVEVIPYDALADRALVILDNIETYLRSEDPITS